MASPGREIEFVAIQSFEQYAVSFDGNFDADPRVRFLEPSECCREPGFGEIRLCLSERSQFGLDAIIGQLGVAQQLLQRRQGR